MNKHNINLSDFIVDQPFEFDFHEPTPEEIEQRKKERALELEEKGFLPENEGYSETMSSPQEEVEKNPTKYIIQECLPACQELWAKNIYTFMVSDHLNEGMCWIEIIADSLSEENKGIYLGMSDDVAIKFSYHKGTINFGVRCVGKEGQRKLLELAQRFQMQDVPKEQAYISPQDFLMRYCDCYEEYPNPNYKPMKAPWESNIPLTEIADYMEKYEQWQESTESKQMLRKFAPEKAAKSIEELANEQGMIFEDGRVYISSFHYNKHLNYVNSMNRQESSNSIKKH